MTKETANKGNKSEGHLDLSEAIFKGLEEMKADSISFLKLKIALKEIYNKHTPEYKINRELNTNATRSIEGWMEEYVKSVESHGKLLSDLANLIQKFEKKS